MALKFRRGTTAQQSGSLAFGEPYVNTTLGTLLIGGPDGDIVLSSGGTGSTGNFGAISGSGLDITGNANIAGNLTLGGQLTIGDATSDTVNVVASLSSSLIPSETNVFDLGSASKIWRDLYISTGSIKFVAGTDVVKELNLTTLTNLEAATGSSNIAIANLNTFSGSQLTKDAALATTTGSLQTSVTNLNTTTASLNTSVSNLNSFSSSQLGKDATLATLTASYDGRFTTLATTTGSLQTSVSNLNTFSGSALTRLSALEVETLNLESFTSSINTTIKTRLNAETVVSGSSQITLSSTTGFSAYSTSVDSRIATEKGRVDAILLSADADKDSFAEIVTLINSVDTTNDAAFASFYTSSTGRLSNLESTSASVNISISNLNTFSGSALTRLSALEVETLNLESFTSSINTTIKTRLNAETVVSGSSQVIGILSSLNTYTGSNDTTNTTQNTRLTALEASASTALSTNNTQATSITNLNSTTASLNTSVSNLNSFSSSALTRLSDLEGKDFTITLTGDVTGTGTVTNLGNVSFATTVAANSVALGTDTTGDYVASLVAGTNITLSNNSGEGATPTIGLTNNAITIAGTSTSLGGSITAATILNGTGVVSGSSQIDVASTTGDIALGTRTSGNYVATITGGTGVSSNGATTGEGIAHTISIGQAVATSDNVRFNSLGIGMAATGTAGRIDAANDVVAFSSSDIRFKENIKPIENAIDKIRKISGNTYDWKEENKVEHGYEGNDVGVIAQEIEAVLPQLVQTRESGYKAVKYDKLVALLIEGIKEQQLQIEQLRIDLNNCRNNKGL